MVAYNDFYVPRISEPVHDFEPESELETRVTNLGVHDNGLGEDADRLIRLCQSSVTITHELT